MKLRPALALLLLCAAPAHAVLVRISCGAVGAELELCRTGATDWAGRTGNTVEILAAPNSSSERLSQYQLLLAARSSDLDVLAIDTTWPGILSDFLAPLDASLPPRWAATQFPAFARADTVGGRVLALPWFIDTGVLLYRKDLLARHHARVPETWEELTETARKIQNAERAAGNPRLWGYVFEGRAYEGLTCNVLEWFHAHGASLLSPGPGGEKAFALASSWIGSISPPAVLGFMEEEAREAFQSGQAVFLRTWPYALKLAETAESPVRGKAGLAAVPGGSGTLGGWSLAVSKFSKHSVEAAQLALHLTGRDEQLRRLKEAGLHPTYPKLYRDPKLVRIFEKAVARPSELTGTRYNRVSAAVWESAHAALSGATPPREAVRELVETLARLRRDSAW